MSINNLSKAIASLHNADTTTKAEYIEQIQWLSRRIKDCVGDVCLASEVELVQQRITDLLDSTVAELEMF